MRPATPLICEFITERRQEFGGATICRALFTLGVPITPRTYWAQVTRPPSKRALLDTTITEWLAASTNPMFRATGHPSRCTGACKMWAHLQRLGVPVARCTIERRTRNNGWRGVMRTKKVRTPIADPAADRAPGPSEPTLHGRAS